MEELRALAGKLGVGGRVIFTGGVERPSRYIRRFDVAVLCSESEGFSNAIIEYMADARPVVCTDTGGNPELVRDGVNGYLVPVGTPRRWRAGCRNCCPTARSPAAWARPGARWSGPATRTPG